MAVGHWLLIGDSERNVAIIGCSDEDHKRTLGMRPTERTPCDPQQGVDVDAHRVVSCKLQNMVHGLTD